MPHQVTMPMLGLTMEEGTITEWLKQEGDTVDKEEPLFVVETDKSAVEVGAPASGVVQKILVPPGKAVSVSTPIAVIAEPGEAAAGGASAAGGAATAVPSAVPTPTPSPPPGPSSAPASAVASAPAAASAPGARARVSPRARMIARELGIDPTSLRGSGPEGRVVERDVRAQASAQPAVAAAAATERVVASPLARKLAAEHGVDLAQISGTGPNGRITEKDVTAHVQAREAAAAAPTVAAAPSVPAAPAAPLAPAAPTPAAASAGTVEPLNRVRRITAERMATSARSVARVTLLMEVDMTEAVRFRGQLAGEFERRYGTRLGYDAMIAKASAIALGEHPHVNAQWQEGTDGQPPGLRLQAEINVGVAVAAEQGLLVAVVREADKKSLHQVNADLAAMVEKSRQNRLGPAELSGSTFTITNLGGYGVESFTPIVNPPESAILGVGRIARKPAVVDDQVVVRDLMHLSLSFDHRVVDGAPAAQFLQRIKQVLEAPYILLA